MLSKPPPASPAFTVVCWWPASGFRLEFIIQPPYLCRVKHRLKPSPDYGGQSARPLCRHSTLLADQPQVGGHRVEIGSERVDVEATTAGVAGIDGQLLRLAIVLEVDEDPLDALLMELVVLAE